MEALILILKVNLSPPKKITSKMYFINTLFSKSHSALKFYYNLRAFYINPIKSQNNFNAYSNPLFK